MPVEIFMFHAITIQWLSLRESNFDNLKMGYSTGSLKIWQTWIDLTRKLYRLNSRREPHHSQMMESWIFIREGITTWHESEITAFVVRLEEPCTWPEGILCHFVKQLWISCTKFMFTWGNWRLWLYMYAGDPSCIRTSADRSKFVMHTWTRLIPDRATAMLARSVQHCATRNQTTQQGTSHDL